MKVGSIQIEPVVDGRALEPLASIVVRDVDGEWDCPAHPVDDQGRLPLDLGGHLIRTGERVLLVDAGIGTAKTAHASGGHLPENLRRLGVSFGEVTDVVFTHLHFDHVGWATQKGKVMFPSATYRVHADDWAHFVTSPSAEPGAIRKLSPIAPQLETFTGETTIAPGVVAVPAPGHTPGHTVFVIADGGERAWLLADVVHTVAELTDPEWRFVNDVDPTAALSVRGRIVEEMAATGEPFAPSHFPGMRFGRVVTSGGRRSWSYL